MSVSVITGASSGIGAALALALAQKGHAVVLVARRQDRLEALAAQLRMQYGVKAHVLAADLTSAEQRRQVLKQAAAWAQTIGEPLTILVNNAGTGVWDDFIQQDEDTLQRDIDLNVSATTHLTRDFVTHALAHRAPSHVLNIASLAGLLPAPGFAVYSATKSYLIAFSEVLAHELKGSNVRVTCVCPGGVQTDFLALAGQKQISNIGMMQAEAVAGLMLDAMFAHKVISVPGLLNQLSALARHLPSGIRSGLVRKSMAMTVTSTRKPA